MFKLSAIRQHFYEMRHYIGFTFILFFAGIVVGGTSNSLSGLLNSQLQGISGLAKNLSEQSNPQLAFMIFIFLNNAIKSIFVMFLGGAFGFIPAAFILFNGMILGHMFTLSADKGVNVFEMIVKGILPHGIIEIPMVVLACAYGIRFGVVVFQTIIRAMFPKRQGALVKEGALENHLYRSVPVMVIIVVALLIAAVIESTVTLWLLRG